MASNQQSQEASVRHVLSFDVEEHFQVSAFWSDARRQQWDRLESRVEQNTLRLADLLAQAETKATFFILGWVAERHPGLVKALAQQGHEIASHGYGHELVTSQTERDFREDVRRSKRILEDLTGERVFGYRAPSFSITARTQWALPILVEEGYLYDSSIFPIRHDRYGMPGANPWCHIQKTEAGDLWEVPPSTLKVGPLRVPVAGGGYFRLYPYRLLRRFLYRVASQGHPLIIYLHPWELDPEQPRMVGSLVSRFRHYVNLHKTESRLRRLVTDFKFVPIQQAVGGIRAICAMKDNLGGIVENAVHQHDDVNLVVSNSGESPSSALPASLSG
jgi:polysaccharide deacetylase family protein (PEP-CTERM system associated)